MNWIDYYIEEQKNTTNTYTNNNRNMKCTLNLVLLFCTASLFAQNSIESTVNNDPETLILETFLSSDCFDVSNINITTFGDSTQIGLFYGGGSSIGIDSGIVFSTGHVDDIVGPNDQDNTSTEYPQNPLPDSIRNIMDVLTNNSTYEVVIVEFDFVPTVPNIEFEYVFASEEYCEYVGEDFFDTFGFIISGPGINGPFPNGGENIALIPGTNDFVNINNINHQVNSQYYIDNTLTSIPRPCNLLAEPAFEQEIEFDGFTVPLKALANVIPCETYHLQLIIADVFQRDRDSGVFLGANSFKAGQPVSVSTGTNALGDGFNAPFEGCSEPYFTFSRANTDVTDSVVVYFTVSAQSTATFGVDFAMLPDSIVIPAGEMSYTLPVEIFADNLDEGIEEIILDVVGSCSCETTSINMFIQDPPPLSVDSPDMFACSGIETMIEPLITGGASPFSYQWEDGSTAASLTISPTDFTTYRVTVTDLCGEEAVSEIFVMPFAPTASMTGDGYSCNNTTNANIDVALTGFGNWEVVYAFNGQNDTISNILQNNISIPANAAGTYELISVSADDCPGVIDGVVEIPNTDVQLNSGSTDNTCFDANDGTINITASNGTAPYSFQWDNLNNGAMANTNMADHNVSGLSDGTFEVSITDANGCQTTSSFTITEPTVLATSVENVVDVNCSNPGQGSINLSTQGGTAPYAYEWNDQSDTEDLNNLDGGTYLVTVSDDNDCSLQLEVIVEEDLETPIIQLGVDDVINCATAELEVSSLGSSLGNEFEYQWTTSDGNIQSQNNVENIIVNQAGNYQLQITNTNNFCESIGTIEVTDDFNYPISEAGNAVTLNCQETSLPLNATASSSGNSFNYQWLSPENYPIDNANSLTPNIQEAGIYYLNVTNSENGCTSIDSVEVFEDVEAPLVMLNSPETLDCNTPSVSLDANGSSTGNEFNYIWRNPNGDILANNGATLDINSAGEYSLEIINTDNGCATTETAEVQEDYNYPMVEAGNTSTITCSENTVSLDGSASDQGNNLIYNWSGPNGGILNGMDAVQSTAQLPGMYYLQIANLDNGCIATDSVEVAINLAIESPTLSPNGILTCSNEDVLIAANFASNDLNYELDWLNDQDQIIDQNNNEISVQTSGIYTLIATNPENACMDTTFVEILQDIEVPIIDLGASTTLNCIEDTYTFQSQNSSNGPSFSYQWSSNNGSFVSATDILQATIDDAGEYTLSITNIDNGCTSNDQINVAIDTIAPQIVIAPAAMITCAQSTIDLDATASSQGNTFSLEWNGPNNSIIINESSLLPSVGQAGTYYLEIENTDNGCLSIDSVEVAIDLFVEAPELSADGILTCEDEEVVIAATFQSNTNNYQLNWYDEQNQIVLQNNDELSVDFPGDFTLVAINLDNACVDSTSVNIAQDVTPPVIDLGEGTTLNCELTNFTIQSQNSSIGNNFEYQWSSNDGSFQSGTDILQAIVNGAGEYSLLITNTDNGCTISDQLIIQIDTLAPSIQIESPDILNCNQSSITIDAFSSSQGNEFEYIWQGPAGSVITGSNTLDPNINSPGQYSLTILNTNNQCESNASIEVTIDTISPVIILQEPDVLTCSQTEVTISSEGSDTGVNFEYQWTSTDNFNIENDNSPTPTMLEAGIYELLLQNLVNGCSSTANIDIEIDTLAPSLVINLPDTINCDQLSVELNLDISSSTQNTIQWSTSSGNIISGGTDDLAIVDAAGFYTVTVNNLLNDCLATAETEVAIDTIAPLAIANVTNILDCNNTSTLIDGSGSSEGEFAYNWTGPNNANIENAQSLMPEVDEPGTYTLLITNTNNFCTASADVIVNQNIEEPIVNILPSEILDCGTTSTSVTAEVDQNNYNFNWQAADGSTIEEGNINSIIVDFPGLISLVVLNPDNGCFTEATTIIEQDIAIPIIDAGEGTVLNCIAPTATLNGTNSSVGNTFSYQWTTSDGQIISAANSLQPLIQGAGLYILEVINTQNECSNQDAVIVSENIPVDASVNASEILCVDDLAEIQISGIQGGEGPYLYSINDGDSFSNFANFTNVEAGTYQIIVQDINGCEWQSEIAIEAPNELDIQLDERAFLTLGQDYQLFLQLNIPEEEVASVQWSPAEGLSCTDCLSPIATPFETTIYQVEVINTNGCKDQTNIRLFVNRDAKVFIPNAFSPNNDGANDSFTAYSDPEMVVQIKNMRIFDRWGNALFERSDFAANDPSLGWDGRFKGSLMNDGVFAYWIEVELIDGTTTTFKGDVAIVK